MLTPIVISALALSAVALFSALYYTFAIAHIVRTVRTVPTLRAGLDHAPSDDDLPLICVVVPAHNEEDVIADLARSLRAQNYPRFSAVFSLDRCTDDTERILRDILADDDRFEIIHTPPRPEGWAGKTHAVHSGVVASHRAQDADYLLFTDADTHFDPDCLRAAVGLLQHRSLDMLSVLSTLTTDRWFERIIQPSAATELMRQNPLLRINRADDPKRFANGQFMLFTRDAYAAVGGHEGVRADILEDLAFARALIDLDRTVGVFVADSLLTCRMYRAWPEFVRGWKRIYIESLRRRVHQLRGAAIRLFGAGVVLPFISLAALILGVASFPTWWAILAAVSGLLGFAIWLTFYAMIFRLLQAPVWCAPLAPIGSCAVATILFRAWRDVATGRGVTWAGVTYLTEGRKKRSRP